MKSSNLCRSVRELEIGKMRIMLQTKILLLLEKDISILINMFVLKKSIYLGMFSSKSRDTEKSFPFQE